ncbi:MAG: calcium/sodium antiporter [Lachnospiraceae bacterium]|nr:calcium/sodium antiporter [Lachnospiraceae bacterium]
MEILLQVVLLVVGFVMLIKGADWFVEGASKVADRFGIPQIVIGLTICAMGTSLPEASVSISAALKGAADITIGNVVGSNIANVLLILGITSLIRPIPVKNNTMRYEIPFTIVITVLLAVLGLMDETVNRIEGIILWAFMIVYLIYLFVISKTDKDAVEEGKTAGENESIIKMIVMIVIGAVLIVLGGNFTVDAATKIALAFGMSERLVGLTIVAFGTSLPELVTSATAAIKGKSDIAIGNIVGSNIFNILFVAGTTALITPVPYSMGFMIDTMVAIAAMVLLYVCVLPKKKLGRFGGLIMLLGYAGYFVYLFQGAK